MLKNILKLFTHNFTALKTKAMPYTKSHKKKTKAKITESARILFNREGFNSVSIDQVMNHAGFTRGGFYNHFKNKEELFQEAVAGFLMGRGEQWRQDAGINVMNPDEHSAQRMIKSYLSKEHLDDIDGQCPMIALPSDIARSDSGVKESYQKLLEGMVYLFEQSLASSEPSQPGRHKALSMAALCVGGMVLAKTLPDSCLAAEVQQAAHDMAMSIAQQNI